MERDQPGQLRVGLCFILERDEDAGTRGREQSKKKVESGKMRREEIKETNRERRPVSFGLSRRKIR